VAIFCDAAQTGFATREDFIGTQHHSLQPRAIYCYEGTQFNPFTFMSPAPSAGAEPSDSPKFHITEYSHDQISQLKGLWCF
jgi:hypothetical protein